MKFDQAKADRQGKDKGLQDVREGAGGGGDAHTAQLVAPQIGRVDRHRLGPAKADQDDHKGADGIEVGEGVEGQPAAVLGGPVTQFEGGQGVGEFVKTECDYQRDDASDKERRIVENCEHGHSCIGIADELYHFLDGSNPAGRPRFAIAIFPVIIFPSLGGSTWTAPDSLEDRSAIRQGYQDRHHRKVSAGR